MRALRLAISLVFLLCLVGCGSNKVMPDVTGKKLDVAKGDIKDAGFDDEVKVAGGGLFGVVMESNWTVCDQSPPAGKSVTGSPRLTVKRSCDDEPQKPSEAPSSSSSETPSASPSETPEPEATQTSDPEEPKTLTAANSRDLAALLKVSDGCDGKVGRFAKKYTGQEIEFNGSIAAMAAHGDAKTRFDMLVSPGDKGPNSTTGPQFQFSDKNSFEMGLAGPKIPDYLKAGQKFRFVAQVLEYNADQCLLQLNPVSTRVR